MPIYCTALKPRQLRAGRRLGLRFLEPRYWEIVKRAMAPGGTRRFAAVSLACADGRRDEIAVGAKGCLCEILESTEGEDGIWNVIVETTAMCRVLSITTEDMHRGPPLIVGSLEELDEDEASQEDDGEDGIDSEVVVLGEEVQLELLRERVQLLELLNAAMELEQARLEQRRLELTMLLSQRRLYQELIDMQTEVNNLFGVTVSPSRSSHSGTRLHRRIPEGTVSASSSSDQCRQLQESQHRGGHTQSHRVPTGRSRSGQGELDMAGLLSLTRQNFDSSTSSVATALRSIGRGSRSVPEATETDLRSRRDTRGANAGHAQRAMTLTEAMRRGSGVLSASRASQGTTSASSPTIGTSTRGRQFHGERG